MGASRGFQGHDLTREAPGWSERNEVKRRLARLKIQVTREDDHNFSTRGFGRSIYFNDPGGASVEVRFYPVGTSRS
jgi:hypothetical protein